MAVFSAAISLILLFLSVSVNGNSPPAVDCSVVIMDMAKCLPFVTVGSQVEKPEVACCNGLKKVIDVNPNCLCESLKNSGSFGIKLNVTKASTLPSLCKLTSPPLSACGLSTTPPATAPVPVPAHGSKPTPASAPGSISTPVSAPAPSPSEKNHGSSLIPISSLSFVFSCTLVLLFSLV